MLKMLTPFGSHFIKRLPCTAASAASYIFPARCKRRLFVSSALNESFTAPYLSARIFCHRDNADMLSEALLCFGADSTSMDAQDHHHQLDDNQVCITSTFPISKDVQLCISSAADSLGFKNIPKYDVQRQDHTDWIKATQDSFDPVKVKEGLWIVPQWKTSPDPQAINIVLNPGLAFGTGEHPTTKLCLLMLHNLVKGGEHFLDYGTGSGILAIAALKFGAVVSVGFDIDPQAITSARYNATLNEIGPENLLLSLVPNKNDIKMLDGFPGEAPGLKDLYNQHVLTEMEKYDIVIANILLNPLLDLADKIASYAKPGAVVGLSGIILEQIPSIVERYSPLLDGIVVSKMDDWACISGYKRKI